MKSGVLNIKERRVHLQEGENWGNNTDQERPKEAAGTREVPPVQEAPRRVQNTGTRASGKRTLSTGVEAAREGTPQNVSFEYSVSNRREKTIGQTQTNFFGQGENAMNSEGGISGDNVYYCSEEDRKMA